jgi:hypothetical protein
MHTDRTATHLGDFTATTRLIPIAALAILIGVFAAYVAAALLKLIGLFTNLFFFQRVDTYHLSREYAIDPLEIVFAREVMRPPEPSGQVDPDHPGDVVAY